MVSQSGTKSAPNHHNGCTPTCKCVRKVPLVTCHETAKTEENTRPSGGTSRSWFLKKHTQAQYQIVAQGIDSAQYLGNISRKKNIWPKAVAYLRDVEMLFDALVTTKEVSNFKFEGMQVIEIDIVIDNDSLDTYL